jgi:hypothetical protein
LGTFRVAQNHHSPPISRPEPTVRDLFYAYFSKATFSAACSACVVFLWTKPTPIG